MRITTTAVLTLLSAPAPAQQPPSCASTLSAFRSSIESNYAGMRLEVTGPRRAGFEGFYQRLADDASRADADECYFVLNRLTGWFEDPHLFVFQSTRIDSAEAARRAASIRVLPTDVDRLLARRGARGRGARDSTRDPIEGVWYDRDGLRVLVVPDSVRGHFLGVLLTSDTTAWPVGAVRATIARIPDGRYAIELYERNFARRHLFGVIHKEAILRLSPGIWAKELPPGTVRGLIDSVVPHQPTLVRRGNTVIVSMVSHDPTYRRVLDSLVAANDSVLRFADKFIVDLRGNEGGAAFTSNSLRPYIESRRQQATPYDGDTAVMLSSPAQIEYARRGFGSDTSAFVRELIARLRANPGALVPLPTSAANDTPLEEIGPAKVAVITDGGTVSAAEVLVLRALRSTRAVVVGEPTRGALDYQSVNIVRVSPGENRWFLGYPTITASAHLPRGGMRGTGIRPDVGIPVDGLWDAIRRAEQLLDARGASSRP